MAPQAIEKTQSATQKGASPLAELEQRFRESGKGQSEQLSSTPPLLEAKTARFHRRGGDVANKASLTAAHARRFPAFAARRRERWGAAKAHFVIAHPVSGTASPTGAASTFWMAWRAPIDRLRPVSITARMSAYCFAPHWERNPLVILRKVAQGRKPRSDSLLVGGTARLDMKTRRLGRSFSIVLFHLTPAG